MLRIELKVTGMACGHCKASVEKALLELGVKDIVVDLENALVKMSYQEEDKITRQEIINAIEEAGYTVF